VRVVLITGPCEPGKCGVGDYSRILAGALRKAGVQTEIVTGGEWRLARLPSLLRLVRNLGADIFHLQYPTAGFGYKLGPQGLSMGLPCVVTLHEGSNSHVLRKLSLFPFSLRTKHMIFTSHEERGFAIRWAPWLEGHSSVIPIGSNIEGGDGGMRRDPYEIVYFGLIMPHKGMDDVLELAQMLRNNGQQFRLRIVGSYRREHANYVKELHHRSEGLPVLWEENLCSSEVRQRLSGARIAYLPFPDGVSERRGSLKAALTNGVAVITTRGKHTPAELDSVVRFCATPADAWRTVCELAENTAEAEDLGNRARLYAKRFSWEAIAHRHISIYERLVARPVRIPEREVDEQITA
jgi:glycosyltransferase involved in cell wall biosynthesis